MNMILRLENEDDYEEVENLTREAFWDIYQPGCVEHLLVHNLRKVSAYIPELDFVAVQDDRIVGNIMYSKSEIVDSEGVAHEVITFGPVSVLPSYQKNGIGSVLIEHTQKLAAEMGFKAIIILEIPPTITGSVLRARRAME
jgi:predicted N-acetyltransferase YhbS